MGGAGVGVLGIEDDGQTGEVQRPREDWRGADMVCKR